MDNGAIASVLREVAVFTDLAGGNAFKARAFEAVARTVEKHPESVAALCSEGRLREIRGIGPSIETAIREIVTEGESSLLHRLRSSFPQGVTDLLVLPGVGPKKVKVIYERLGIASLAELEYACREDRLAGLEGFGVKSQANILRAIEFRKTTQSSRLYSEALEIGGELVRLAGESGLFHSVDLAGSLRRGKATFKDIDILLVPAPAADPAAMRDLLISFADVEADGPSVIGAGDTKVSIRRQGLQVDFRIVPQESYAAALQHFTGSKEHNTHLRSRAKGMGLKMSEWGVFGADEKPLAVKDEAEVYARVGLPWIPPELREADGEIEAAETGTLPRLVEEKDFRGMIHVHSTAPDGKRSVEELAQECIRRGYSWLCISDHSRSAVYAGGLSIEALLTQVQVIRGLNRAIAPFRVFAGVESEILPDGSLDYPDEVLAELDFVIGSAHSQLTLDRERSTARLAAAARNPRLTILGHISGRLLLGRDGYQWDEPAVLAALASGGAALEHNCNPHRLDPDWDVLRRAARLRIPIAINPDAHDIAGFDDMRFGVVMARKAWLTKASVLNCMSTEEIDAWFASRREA